MSITVKKMRRLRKVRCTIALLLLILVMMFMCGGWHKVAGADTGQPMNSVIVCQGDTIWGLVQQHYEYKGDIRKAVYEVKRLNGLKSAEIMPGQVLLIPKD